MDCADYIESLGNSPQGNYLSARYRDGDMPDSVTIKGTTDTQPLRGNSGVWRSGNKYTTLKQTLILNKNGAPVKECSYNELGVPPIQDAAVTGFKGVASPGFVNISWTTTKEIQVSVYILDRKIPGGVYEEGVTAVFPDFERATPKDYSTQDSPTAVGTYVYRLRAKFDDGTYKNLSESAPVDYAG